MRVLVDDREFPATRHLGPTLTLTDEIYQLNRYSRDKVRVLMRLDTSSVDMTKKNVERTDGDYALTWVRDFGKGACSPACTATAKKFGTVPRSRRCGWRPRSGVLKLTDGQTKSFPLPTD
ncbi:MAG: hypothetical protein R2724_18050 [Bryobacterales bacterium]